MTQNAWTPYASRLISTQLRALLTLRDHLHFNNTCSPLVWLGPYHASSPKLGGWMVFYGSFLVADNACLQNNQFCLENPICFCPFAQNIRKDFIQSGIICVSKVAELRRRQKQKHKKGAISKHWEYRRCRTSNPARRNQLFVHAQLLKYKEEFYTPWLLLC